HHPEVLQHPHICLPSLVRERLESVEQERRAVEQRLLKAREQKDRLAQLDEILAGFDPATYRTLVCRLMVRDRVPTLAAEYQRAPARRDAAAIEMTQLRDRLATAEGRVRELAGTRAVYAHIDALRKERDDATAATDRLVADALHARGEVERLAAWLRRLD